MFHESSTSKAIRLTAEVEKIWIKYDNDNSGTLEMNEIEEFVIDIAKNQFEVPSDIISYVFKKMDLNQNKEITRDEMYRFMETMSNF